jgi:hypothetical protein
VNWKTIIAEMPPDRQAEVRRIADKMTKLLLKKVKWIPAPPRKPGEPIKFRRYKEARD